MASQDLTLIIKAQNLAGQEFDKLKAGLASVEQQAKKLPPVTDEWSNSMQRAAQKMERMHEEALKMNTGFKSSSDQAQQFAQTLSQVSSTATASAAALGLPVGPLTTLNALLPVASLGFTQLTKSAVAFNVASLGVVGAGLVIGAAIGTMLREIPRLGAMTLGIRDIGKSSDDVVMAMARWMGLLDNLPPKLTAVEQKATNLAVTIKKLAEAADRGEVGPGQQNILDAQDAFYNEQKRAAEQAAKERIAIAKQVAAERLRIEKQLNDDLLALEKQWTADDQQRMLNELKDYQDWKKEQLEIEEQFSKDSWKNEEDRLAGLRRLLEDYWDEQERQFNAEKKRFAEQAELFANLGDSLRIAGDLWIAMGKDAESALVQSTRLMAGLASAAQGVLSALARGDTFGAITAGLGGFVSILGDLVGDGGTARRTLQELREELDKLAPAAEQAGIAIDGIGIAIDQAAAKGGFLSMAMDAVMLRSELKKINDEIALWEDATDKTREAMERYGITIDQMGERFAQQELDKMFGDLYQDYQLLIAAGADVELVNEKMADAINEYIQNSIKAGTEVPENMRPILESLIDQGLLTDEAGNKLENLDSITFGESTTAMEELVLAVQALVNALRQALGLSLDLGGAFKKFPPGWELGDPPPPGWGDPPPPPPKAEGGWFPFRPGGYPVTVGEVGNEAIIPEEKLAGIVARAVAMAGGSYQSGGEGIVVHSQLHVDGRVLGKSVSKSTRRRQTRLHPNGSHTGRY